jgi:HEAT repeat protein
MNCQEANYLIDATETENLNADQKQAVDQHLQSCRTCQETWAAFRQLSAIEIPAMPRDLRSCVVSSLNPPKVRGTQRSLTLGAILVVGAAIAAGVALRIDDTGPKGADGPMESVPIDASGASAATTPNLSAIQPEGAEVEDSHSKSEDAAHLFVLTTSQRQDSRESLKITTVNVATGIVSGSVFFSSLLRNKWPENLKADVDDVVEFIEEERTVYSPNELSAAVEDAWAAVLNASLQPIERVKAVGRLSRAAEARDSTIVTAAVELATIAPELRGTIWRAMYGADDPYLIEPMLQSLTYDASEVSHRFAAGSLGTFVSNPDVRAALHKAQTSDPSETVRMSAQAALQTDEDRNSRAFQILADESLPALERLSALTVHDGGSVRAVPLTDEAARVLFDIGETSTDPEIRGWAWSSLGGNDNQVSDFKRVFLDDLANHPSELVRRMAAFALRPYTNDRDVRTALERAEGDPSFEVRSAARTVLAKDHR